MHDPFIIAAPERIIKGAQPLARALTLHTLPYHIHEILLAYTVYSFTDVVVSPALSSHLFPKFYPQSQRKAKVNWDVHFVSLVQSCFIIIVALWVIYTDKERHQMDVAERVWGYTGASGMVQGFAAGYFLWDLRASVRDVDVHGWGALIHAASALVVTCLGFVSFSFGVYVEYPNYAADWALSAHL